MEELLGDLPAGSEVIAQGAEAIVAKTPLFPPWTPAPHEPPVSRSALLKQRFVKKYRHVRLDEQLSEQRVKEESRMLLRASKEGIDCPTLYHTDLTRRRIYMEFIQGTTLKTFLQDLLDTNKGSSSAAPSSTAAVANHHENPAVPAAASMESHASTHLEDVHMGVLSSEQQLLLKELEEKVGTLLAKLHLANIVHGDLTTSNIMVRGDESRSLVLIDFGLSYSSTMLEDKAVDLYVLERAFLSTHPGTEEHFNKVLKVYEEASPKCKQVLDRLEEVRIRGRKRSMLG